MAKRSSMDLFTEAVVVLIALTMMILMISRIAVR